MRYIIGQRVNIRLNTVTYSNVFIQRIDGRIYHGTTTTGRTLSFRDMHVLGLGLQNTVPFPEEERAEPAPAVQDVANTHITVFDQILEMHQAARPRRAVEIPTDTPELNQMEIGEIDPSLPANYIDAYKNMYFTNNNNGRKSVYDLTRRIRRDYYATGEIRTYTVPNDTVIDMYVDQSLWVKPPTIDITNLPEINNNQDSRTIDPATNIAYISESAQIIKYYLGRNIAFIHQHSGRNVQEYFTVTNAEEAAIREKYPVQVPDLGRAFGFEMPPRVEDIAVPITMQQRVFGQLWDFETTDRLVTLPGNPFSENTWRLKYTHGNGNIHIINARYGQTVAPRMGTSTMNLWGNGGVMFPVINEFGHRNHRSVNHLSNKFEEVKVVDALGDRIRVAGRSIESPCFFKKVKVYVISRGEVHMIWIPKGVNTTASYYRNSSTLVEVFERTNIDRFQYLTCHLPTLTRIVATQGRVTTMNYIPTPNNLNNCAIEITRRGGGDPIVIRPVCDTSKDETQRYRYTYIDDEGVLYVNQCMDNVIFSALSYTYMDYSGIRWIEQTLAENHYRTQNRAFVGEPRNAFKPSGKKLYRKRPIPELKEAKYYAGKEFIA